MEKGLISVIIPVYNREEYLEECIESLYAQTYQGFEIILIDDGSTDNTLKMCYALSEKDGRIIVLEENHSGVSKARNVGLDIAQGEFVFFLDSDDVIHPCLLEALVSGLNNTDAGMAGTHVVNTGKEMWHRVKQVCGEERSMEYTYHSFDESVRIITQGYTPFGCIGGVMMRRDLIGETRFRSEFYIGEDFLFIYENLIKGAGTVFLNKKLYYTRIHENNSSWDWMFSGFLNRYQRREWVWKKEEELGRIENANAQKSSVIGCFRACVSHNKPYSAENKKIRRFMKKQRNTLFPALSRHMKIEYFLGCYFPYLYSLFTKNIGLIKKIIKH